MPSAALEAVRGAYVHVPFCDGKCHYCAFYSVPYARATAARWLRALAREMQPWRGARLQTIYIGGGTPSLLPPAQWDELAGLLRATFSISAGAEWSVETNPGSITPAGLRRMAAAGVNRISLGAQSFHDHELQLLGRRHGAADIARAAAAIRAAGIVNFNLDLLAGIPGSAPRDWRMSLHSALDLQPAHLSVYALTMEEGTRLAQLAGRHAVRLPDADAQLAALDTAEKILRRAGFARYEISNYARPGRACRHNLDCWRGKQYLGFGPAAASHVNRTRWQNRPDLPAYLAALENGGTPPRESEQLTPALARTERLIFGLRLAEGVSCRLATARHQTVLQRLTRAGLTRRRRGRWRLTRRGRELADYAAVELLE